MIIVLVIIQFLVSLCTSIHQCNEIHALLPSSKQKVRRLSTLEASKGGVFLSFFLSIESTTIMAGKHELCCLLSIKLDC